jgi:hypothetical protein
MMTITELYPHQQDNPSSDPVAQCMSAIAYLSDFSSPSRVAHLLRERGARGYRGSPTSCPIARYMQDFLPAGTMVAVLNDELHFSVGGRRTTIMLTDCLRCFVRWFDSGRFKFLDQSRRNLKPGPQPFTGTVSGAATAGLYER